MALKYFRVWFGDDELVLNGDYRYVEADHGTSFSGKAAGRRDDVLAGNGALLGSNEPLA